MRPTIFSLFCLLLISCAGKTGYAVTIDNGGTKIVTGVVERSVIESDSSFQWFHPTYTAYHPDSEIVQSIRPHIEGIHFILFFGTWCGDSKREIPKLFKVFDALNLSSECITLYGLDRTKKSSDGMTGKYSIKSVPTLIVQREDSELGRIVETPSVTMEKDLLKILQKK